MNCPLCSTPLESAAVISERARAISSRRVVCAACGLVQVSPQPSKEELTALNIGEKPEAIRAPGFDLQPGSIEWGDWIEARNANRSRIELHAFDEEATRIAAGWIYAYAIDVLPHNMDLIPRTAALYDTLERWPDPVVVLSRMRKLGTQRVIIEVADVDEYRGDREALHYHPARLYDFSVSTLTGVMLRAGFGSIRVLAHNGRLTAWGTANAPGIMCDDAEARVRQLTAEPMMTVPPMPETTAIEAFIADKPFELTTLRAELEALRAVYGAMLASWDDARRDVSALQDAWSRHARSHIESNVPDAWLAGAQFGRGVAFDAAAKAVSHVLHRMGRLSGAYR